jgi:histidinol-phosphatase (PHP family)
MHTPLCHHATGEPVDYAAAPSNSALTEIGFSDHSPMRATISTVAHEHRKLDEYVAKVRSRPKRFPQLTIRLALEVDYLPGHEDWIRNSPHASVGLFHRLRALRFRCVGD